MKILIVLFLTIVIAPQVCRAQTTGSGSTSVADLSFSINTNLLINQKYFEKQGNDVLSSKIQTVSSVFSEINSSSTEFRPSPEYLAALRGYDKAISVLQKMSQPVALQILNDIQADMEAKMQRGNSMRLDDKLTRPVKVKVVTRRIVDGKEVDVPGCMIKYKLWFLRNEQSPLFNFSNPTLQAEKSITPGNYDIWAEVPGSARQYPVKRSRTRIPDVDGDDIMTIILLLN